MGEKHGSAQGWWYARFRIQWPEKTEPSWHIDLLLAHKLLSPILYTYKSEITLWRFHRMATRDSEGHQFSLIFYATPRTASGIFNTIQSDPLLIKLKRSGAIIQDVYDDTDNNTAPNIGDRSDPHWNPAIRESWPHFIMGVCQMWLTLITIIAENTPQTKKITSLSKMIDFYRRVNDTITKLWRDQGSHALLHHLNAIYGYEPVLVYEANLKRF
jgi:hypothetical protein